MKIIGKKFIGQGYQTIMEPEIKLPKGLLDKYRKIKQKFAKICMDWKKYNDQIIPEDREFGAEIAEFIISVLEHMEKNYDSIDISKWTEFLWTYNYCFYYGTMGDDRNYLSFDEADIFDIFLEHMSDWCENPPKQKIAKLRKIFIDAKKKIENGQLKNG